jgi:hypothetical protein
MMDEYGSRCLACGSSELDSKGRKCGLCGQSIGLRSEACYVSKETQQRLLEHSKKLLKLGVELRQHETLQFKAPEVVITERIALEVDEPMRTDTLRALVGLLRDLSVPEEEVLRLRLDEPERIRKHYRTRIRNSQPTGEKVAPTKIPELRVIEGGADAITHRQGRAATKARGHAKWRQLYESSTNLTTPNTKSR